MKRNSVKVAIPVERTAGGGSAWFAWMLWIVAAGMVAMLVFLLVSRFTAESATAQPVIPTPIPTVPVKPGEVSLPVFEPAVDSPALARLPVLHTDTSNQTYTEVRTYTVLEGDALFNIAKEFNIKPETLLFANYDVLQDDPHALYPGQVLTIPPTDGIYYKWKENDTIEEVAARFKVKPEAILTWPGNHLDLTSPQIEKDAYVMVPGGQREFKSWVVATVWVPRSGTTKSLGANCPVTGVMYGSGYFIWPTMNHYLSGNDYWSGHLAIDIATPAGEPIKAADAGVVVYASWNSSGYGNVVMIDHGNGYHTLYAHLSGFNTYCGAPVAKGKVIGYAGSTGRSTGPHLHFEVRYLGGFVNPWTVLP